MIHKISFKEAKTQLANGTKVVVEDGQRDTNKRERRLVTGFTSGE